MSRGAYIHWTDWDRRGSFNKHQFYDQIDAVIGLQIVNADNVL